MKFCSECFNDTEICNLIENIENEDICDITNKKSAHIYDSEKHNFLKEYFEDLLNVYTPVSAIGSNIDKANAVKLKYDLLENNWNIFSDKCKHSDVYTILKNVCVEKYEEMPEIFNEDVIIQELYDEKYKIEHSLLKNYTWDDFTSSLKYYNRFHSKHLQLNILKKACFATTKIHKKGERLYRGRISNKEGFLKTEMSVPPIEKAIEGRVNSAGIQC